WRRRRRRRSYGGPCAFGTGPQYRKPGETRRLGPMTLQDASNIAQVISAVAVVVSLIYVALEIRHNSYELRISTQQAQADAATGYLIPLGLDPMLEQIVGRFAGGRMGPVDELRLSLICNGVFAQFQAGWEAARTERRALRPWWTYQERALSS